MEDVLEVYHRPYDPKRPVVCVDETFKQLVGETREPLPMRPGTMARYDYVYTRNGVASLFLACEPLAGWRHLAVTDHRCRRDWALFIRALLEGRYRDAEKLVLVMDQLNTHSPASLYEAFPPEEAKRLADRLEIHHTPKHGSWLNQAEIELSVLARQCLMGLPTRGQASDVTCLVLPRERSAMPQEAARWRQAPVPLVASWPTLARRARPPARSGARGDPSDLSSLRGS
jgi:hypothetical protein